MTALLPLVGTFVGGFALGAAVFSYVSRPTDSQMELTNKNIALTILAGEAIGHLDPEDREAFEEQAEELIADAFGQDAAVEIEGVTQMEDL